MASEDLLKSTNLPNNPERATLEGKNKFLGFWFFLGGETVLFASLFGTYLALQNSHMDGTPASELFAGGLGLVFLMTMLLLTSSLTSVLAIHHMRHNNAQKMNLWFIVTIILGLGFLGCEIYEFYHYVNDYGHGFTTSAFSSAFYALVGFHGAHVAFGLGWMISLVIRNWKRGINLYNAPKFYIASLYWHFIDVVWVFIFTVVYLMGVLS